MATIEKELAYFGEVKDQLIEHHEGKFVLIHGCEVIGIWDTQERAYIDGVTRFGNVPLLIKQIDKTERVEEIPLLFVGE